MSNQHPFLEILKRVKTSISASEEGLPEAASAEGLPQATATVSGNDLVSVSGWNACYTNENEIALYCTVTPNDSGNPITTIGLALSSLGTVIASSYTAAFSSDNVAPSINSLPNGLRVGSTVDCIVFGVLAGGQFFSLQESLTVGSC
ncbi:MAG TPA: hypothetical protein VGX92_17015 [Pyrinomonadaceae bacterium]|jgi:hypothetical protein|nr:hypothetical protein [Pyrinomonadaceae bacterium]